MENSIFSVVHKSLATFAFTTIFNNLFVVRPMERAENDVNAADYNDHIMVQPENHATYAPRYINGEVVQSLPNQIELEEQMPLLQSTPDEDQDGDSRSESSCLLGDLLESVNLELENNQVIPWYCTLTCRV